MAKIHGIVYLIIGIIMFGVSFVINKTHNNSTLTLFIYVSYIFMAVGIAKLIVNYIMNKNKKDVGDVNIDNTVPQFKPLTDNKSNNTKNNLFGYIGVCPNCSTPMRRINVYCHRCGRKQTFK